MRAADQLSLCLIYSPLKPSPPSLAQLRWNAAHEVIMIASSGILPCLPFSARSQLLVPDVQRVQNGSVPANQEPLHSDRIDAESGDVSQSGCGRVEALSLSDVE